MHERRMKVNACVYHLERAVEEISFALYYDDPAWACNHLFH